MKLCNNQTVRARKHCTHNNVRIRRKGGGRVGGGVGGGERGAREGEQNDDKRRKNNTKESLATDFVYSSISFSLKKETEGRWRIRRLLRSSSLVSWA